MKNMIRTQLIGLLERARIALQQQREWRLLRVDLWSSRAPKVRSRYLLKRKEIVFGDGPEADIRGFDSPRLLARLDLRSLELHDLQTGAVRVVEEGEAFELNQHILQYRFLRPAMTWLILPAASLLLLMGARYGAAEAPVCSGLPLYVASGKWSEPLELTSEREYLSVLVKLRRHFREALQENDLILAKSYLEEIRQKLRELEWPSACHANEAIGKLQGQFSEQVIKIFQKDGDFVAAAEEVLRWETVAGRRLNRERSRLHRNLRRAFLNAYRNEARDPEAAELVYEKVSDACRALGELETCYRVASLTLSESASVGE